MKKVYLSSEFSKFLFKVVEDKQYFAQITIKNVFFKMKKP